MKIYAFVNKNGQYMGWTSDKDMRRKVEEVRGYSYEKLNVPKDRINDYDEFIFHTITKDIPITHAELDAVFETDLYMHLENVYSELNNRITTVEFIRDKDRINTTRTLLANILFYILNYEGDAPMVGSVLHAITESVTDCEERFSSIESALNLFEFIKELRGEL